MEKCSFDEVERFIYECKGMTEEVRTRTITLSFCTLLLWQGRLALGKGEMDDAARLYDERSKVLEKMIGYIDHEAVVTTLLERHVWH